MAQNKAKMENGHYATTQLFPYKQYWTFQGYYKVKSAEGKELAADDVFNKCILHIMKWLKDRTHKDKNRGEELSFLDCYPDPEDYASFELFSDGERTLYQRSMIRYDISIFAYKDEKTWTIRIVEPNSIRKNSDGSKKRLRREQVFITNAAIKKTEDGVYLTSRITCKEPADNIEDAEVYRPAYMYYIYQDPELFMKEGDIESDKYPINGTILSLNTNSGTSCRCFYEELLNSEQRQQPIVLVPTAFEKNNDKIMKTIDKLAGRTAGFAYFIKEESDNKYTKLFNCMGRQDLINHEKIQKEYCMVIYPGKDGEIVWCPTNLIDVQRENFKLAELEKLLRSYTVRRDGIEKSPAYSYGDVLFNSGLWNKYVENVETAAGHGHDFFEELKEELDSEANKKIIKKIDDYEQEFQKLRKDNIIIKKELDIYRAKQNKIEEFKAEIASLKQENKRLEKAGLLEEELESRKEADELRRYVEKFINPYRTVTVGPQKEEEVIQWIKENFSDTIFLHKDGENAYKKYSDNSPVDVVCRCIIYLSAYVKLKRGDITIKEFLALGNSELLSDAHSESAGGAESLFEIESKLKSGYTDKTAMSAVKIKYDGAVRPLDYHVGSNIGNDGNTTRIYFLYDDKIKKAVIGSMPDHLGDGSGHNNRTTKA